MKKLFISNTHSTSRHLDITSTSCNERLSLMTSQTEPTAPAFSFQAPKINLLIRDCNIAPAHIAHGSRVTTIVKSSNRQLPTFSPASRSATISAWAVGSFHSSRRFRPRPNISPNSLAISAPTGTSPLSEDCLASNKACCIND